MTPAMGKASQWDALMSMPLSEIAKDPHIITLLKMNLIVDAEHRQHCPNLGEVRFTITSTPGAFDRLLPERKLRVTVLVFATGNYGSLTTAEYLLSSHGESRAITYDLVAPALGMSLRSVTVQIDPKNQYIEQREDDNLIHITLYR